MVPPLHKRRASRPSGRSLSPFIRTALALPLVALTAGVAQTKPTFQETEKKCLATAIYFEARGEPKIGQKAVAQVILNRVEAEQYPDTICGVVYQNRHRKNACQFSFACDGRSEVPHDTSAWERANEIGDDVIGGRDLLHAIKAATHYHADYVNPHWAPKMRRLSKVGRHIFYQA